MSLKKFTIILFLLTFIILSTFSQENNLSCDKEGINGNREEGEIETSLLEKNILNSPLPKDWWKNAVFYELYIRSFKDSNGDGHGDIRGLIEKLDYLHDLGIKGIWLLPITEDPENDHGYNVSDCRAIDDTYGTMADFNELLLKAHLYGIGVIIDIIPNHISPEHPYFISAKKSKDSKFRNFFLWSDNYISDYYDIWDGNNHPWYSSPTGYYYSTFCGDFPDLNYRDANGYVKIFMTNNIIYWLNNRVDGFRFDAISHLVENGTTRAQLYDQPETVKIMKDFSEVIRLYENRFTIGEQSGSETYLGNGSDLLNSTFSWNFAFRVIQTVKNRSPQIYGGAYTLHNVLIEDIISGIPYNTKRATILSNHDSICGDRPFTQFEGDKEKCKLAASIYLLTPGIPFIYYGEEIGMKKYDEMDSDGALRTPMQWMNTDKAGFTTGKPYRPINPNYTDCNVNSELLDPFSILNHYKNLIAIRNAHESLMDGNYNLLKIDSSCWSFLRKKNDDIIAVILNFSNSPKDISLNFSSSILSSGTYSAGNDLLDTSIPNPTLSDNNRSNYPVSIPACGVRIINFIKN